MQDAGASRRSAQPSLRDIGPHRTRSAHQQQKLTLNAGVVESRWHTGRMRTELVSAAQKHQAGNQSQYKSGNDTYETGFMRHFNQKKPARGFKNGNSAGKKKPHLAGNMKLCFDGLGDGAEGLVPLIHFVGN